MATSPVAPSASSGGSIQRKRRIPCRAEVAQERVEVGVGHGPVNLIGLECPDRR